MYESWYENVLIEKNIPTKPLTVKIQYYTLDLALRYKSVLVAKEALLYNKYLNIGVNCEFILHCLTLPLITGTKFISPASQFNDIPRPPKILWFPWPGGCMDILEGYGIWPLMERVLYLYWDHLLILAWTWWYYDPPFQGLCRVTHGDPLYPTI